MTFPSAPLAAMLDGLDDAATRAALKRAVALADSWTTPGVGSGSNDGLIALLGEIMLERILEHDRGNRKGTDDLGSRRMISHDLDEPDQETRGLERDPRT